MSQPERASARETELMALALEQARLAAARGEVPVGAVLARSGDGEVIARAGNEIVREADPTAHAELLAVRRAASLTGAPRLPGTTLFVTLEPCLMCLGALVLARVEEVVFAAEDPKVGATGLLGRIPLGPEGLNHALRARRGPFGEQSAALLRSFFRARREDPAPRWPPPGRRA